MLGLAVRCPGNGGVGGDHKPAQPVVADAVACSAQSAAQRGLAHHNALVLSRSEDGAGLVDELLVAETKILLVGC